RLIRGNPKTFASEEADQWPRVIRSKRPVRVSCELVVTRSADAVFARKLRINERTLEKREQGRAKPNPQAAALVLLVRKYPDTLERLERVAAGGSATRRTE